MSRKQRRPRSACCCQVVDNLVNELHNARFGAFLREYCMAVELHGAIHHPFPRFGIFKEYSGQWRTK